METGGKQIPWELSSLQGEFYFMPGSGKMATDITKPGKIVIDKDESSLSAAATTDAFDDESRKLEDEERKLEKEKVLLEKKKALKERRQKIEEEKAALDEKKTATLAMAKLPSVPTAKEVKRDGRFVAYDNGTVLDTRTSLMWAARDNGADINWQDAKSYCENYRGGGYTDWQIPTMDELAGLYDTSKTYESKCRATFGGTYATHLTELIHLTCVWSWTSGTSGYAASLFNFYDGIRYSYPHSTNFRLRTLPVRSAK